MKMSVVLVFVMPAATNRPEVAAMVTGTALTRYQT
jgi:hypothetical protein